MSKSKNFNKSNKSQDPSNNIGPLSELFPLGNNLALRDSAEYRNKIKNIEGFQNSISSAQCERSESINQSELESLGDSIDTNIVKEIAVEYRPNKIKENLVNNRYWVSEIYGVKAKVANEINTDNGQNSEDEDFVQYSKKVEKEYRLRDKLETVMKNRGDVEVLNANKLEYFFDSHPEEEEGSLLKGASPNFFGGIKNHITNALHVFKNSDQESSTMNLKHLNSSSNGTKVLDYNIPLNVDQRYYLDDFNDHFSDQIHFNQGINSGNSNKKEHFKRTYLNWKASQSQFYVRRSLSVEDLNTTAIGACLGVGLFVLSGRIFYVCGPLGSLLGFVLCGSIVICTLLSFSELSSFIPLSSGFSGLASRFVSDAVGFAVGWSYWMTYLSFSANETVTTATILQGYFSTDSETKVAVISVTLSIILTLSINLLNVRTFCTVVRYSSYTKILLTILLMIVMVVLNTGGAHTDYVGFRYWDKSKTPSNFSPYGPFRPTFNPREKISDGNNYSGIGGSVGRFLGVLYAVLGSVYAFAGVELSFVANAEALNPKVGLPSAIKRTFCTIISLYILSVFLVGLNIYSGDPKLRTKYDTSVISSFGESEKNKSCHQDLRILEMMSPWVLALQNFGFCTFAKAFNAILVFFGLTCGCCALYASSRSLYTLSIQNKAPSVFTICSRAGVPYVAVLFSGMFQFISYLAVNKHAITNFQVFSNISSLLISIIWCVMNVSFLRFFFALQKRTDIITRNSAVYPYKSPMQPYMAIYGLLGSVSLIVLMGFTNFLKSSWSTKDFFSSYGSLMVFGGLYCGYFIFGSSKIPPLDQLDLDSGRQEMDGFLWNDKLIYDTWYHQRLGKLLNMFK